MFLEFEIGQICLIHFLKMSSFVSSLSFSSAAENVFTIFSLYCHFNIFCYFSTFFLPFSTFFGSFFDLFFVVLSFDIFYVFVIQKFFVFDSKFFVGIRNGENVFCGRFKFKNCKVSFKKKKEKDYANWYFTFKLENDFRSIKNRNVFLYS